MIISYPLKRSIISSFENMMDHDKIQEYTEIMRMEMLSHEFPPILGFETIITEEDVGKFFMMPTEDLGSEDYEIRKEDIGRKVWSVTDGHHRTIAALNCGLGWIDVMKDRSCCVTIEELKEYDHN